MQPDFMIYGSYGYTGELIARQAVESGLRPLLTGRDAAKLAAQAGELGLEYVAFSLDDPEALADALRQVPVVLHCAGPYTFTARQMVDACLLTGTHYLDLTGEIRVFSEVQARDTEARSAGVMLLPGAGFDVTATDCLALHLKQRLPEANLLEIAYTIRGPGRASQGTLRSGVEMLGDGLLVRQDGELVRAPQPGKRRMVDFGRGPVMVSLFTWGDVFTAYFSTGIPNIEVYTYLPERIAWLVPAGHRMSALFSQATVKRFLRDYINRLPPGPTAEQRSRTRTYLWGRVSDGNGRAEIARMQGPEAGYSWTVDIALQAVRKVLAGTAPAGYQTPASAFGADFILECGGSRQDDDSLI
jgi:short subunit dehydrogenase-like uncharacterized protein